MDTSSQARLLPTHHCPQSHIYSLKIRDCPQSHLHPHRYVNNGRRIDYILADRQLHECHVETGPELWYTEDEAGALAAATAGGRWVPRDLSPHRYAAWRRDEMM